MNIVENITPEMVALTVHEVKADPDTFLEVITEIKLKNPKLAKFYSLFIDTMAARQDEQAGRDGLAMVFGQLQLLAAISKADDYGTFGG